MVRPQQQQGSPLLSTIAIDEDSNIVSLKYLQMLMGLYNLGQTLCEQTSNASEHFTQEITRITGGCAHLVLDCEQTPSETMIAVIFPVRFCKRIYGKLCILSDPIRPECPSVPLIVAHLLANTCGTLLYNIETSKFIKATNRQLESSIRGSLTKREREILACICQGYGSDTIAEKLCIAPATVTKHRQNIYSKLGVSSLEDARLAAYQHRFFSILEKS